MVYLDHAGAALPSRSQLQEVNSMTSSMILSNPHSHHSTSRITRNIVENARQRVLDHFNTTANEYAVVFTANTTHSLKIVAENFVFEGKKRSSCEISPELKPGPCFAYLLDSHNSIVGLREIVRCKTDYVTCLLDLPESIPRTIGSLFMMTAASNFNGRKYDLRAVKEFQDQGWSVCLDAASLVSTCLLDLNQIQPDFVAISFYKMFGYPTGLGALLIKKDSIDKLSKVHFSGGTVASALPSTFVSHQRSRIEDRFEDGTVNYYAIAALQKGFDDLEKYGGTHAIQSKTLGLAKSAYAMLKDKFHWNGKAAVELYHHDKKFEDSTVQAPIVCFNLKDEEGAFIGYSEVAKMADLFGIDLRSGCFCNIGACQMYLILSDEDILANMESGKECGDELDLLNGRPTGAVRISFGRQSTEADIEALSVMIDYCFLRSRTTIEIDHPLSIQNYRPVLSKILCYPIKSCRAVERNSCLLTQTGLHRDRTFMIVSNDVTLSQKKFPQMTRLGAEIDESTSLMTVSCAGKDVVSVDLTDNNSNVRGNVVCVNTVSSNDCGDVVAAWLDAALGMTSCRLRRMAADSERSLSNEAPYLLVNESSIKLLADQIGLCLDDAILRFRPNLVVRGLPPFIEDTAESFTLAGAEFTVTGKCTRCEMICVDQETGEKDPSLIIALRNLRNRERMTFGVYVKEVEQSGRSVAVGDGFSFI